MGFALGEPPPQAVPAQGVLEKSPVIATGSKAPRTENVFPKQLKAPERRLFYLLFAESQEHLEN